MKVKSEVKLLGGRGLKKCSVASDRAPLSRRKNKPRMVAASIDDVEEKKNYTAPTHRSRISGCLVGVVVCMKDQPATHAENPTVLVLDGQGEGGVNHGWLSFDCGSRETILLLLFTSTNFCKKLKDSLTAQRSMDAIFVETDRRQRLHIKLITYFLHQLVFRPFCFLSASHLFATLSFRITPYPVQPTYLRGTQRPHPPLFGSCPPTTTTTPKLSRHERKALTKD